MFATRKSGKKESVWVAYLRLFLSNPIMDKAQILALITQAKPILETRFGVIKLALFGSFARETNHPGSDIDILVDFEGKVDADRYFGVLFFLEDLFNEPIDLVTREGLRPEFRHIMEKDAIDV